MPQLSEEIRHQLNQIEEAFRDYAVSDCHPCGGYAYYDQGQLLPWRVLYVDDCTESFATAEEAMQAANHLC